MALRSCVGADGSARPRVQEAASGAFDRQISASRVYDNGRRFSGRRTRAKRQNHGFNRQKRVFNRRCARFGSFPGNPRCSVTLKNKLASPSPSFSASTRCPDDDTGKNSVKPCNIPKKILFIISAILSFFVYKNKLLLYNYYDLCGRDIPPALLEAI